jgi:hypothetical protein
VAADDFLASDGRVWSLGCGPSKPKGESADHAN